MLDLLPQENKVISNGIISQTLSSPYLCGGINPITAGQSATLCVDYTPAPGGGTISYSYQRSLDGLTNWITVGSSPSITTSDSGFYRVIVEQSVPPLCVFYAPNGYCLAYAPGVDLSNPTPTVIKSTSGNYQVTLAKCVNPVPSIAVSRTDNTLTGLNANTIALGYGSQSVTLTASNSTSTASATSYQWSPATGLSSTTTASTVFTPTTAGTFTFKVTATTEFGCSASTTVTIRVIDVRCGNKNDKVIVCHKTGSSSNPTTQICISPNAVATHLSHGDNLGSCPSTYVSSATMSTLDNESTIANPKELTVVATPNPTTDVFKLHITSNDVKTNASVRVVDAVGRPLDTFYKVAIGSTVTFGQMYFTGYYFAEISQGTQHKIVKLMKAK